MGMCKLLQMMRASFLQRLRRGPPFSHKYNTTNIPSLRLLLTDGRFCWREKALEKNVHFTSRLEKKSAAHEWDWPYLFSNPGACQIKANIVCAFMKNRWTYDSFLVFHRILRNCKIAWFAKSRHVLWWCTLFPLEIKINDSANYDLAKYIRDDGKFPIFYAV